MLLVQLLLLTLLAVIENSWCGISVVVLGDLNFVFLTIDTDQIYFSAKKVTTQQVTPAGSQT